MSLTFNFTDCPDSTTCRSKTEWPVSQAIIWLLLAVGVPRLKTDDDIREAYRRIQAYERVRGNWLGDRALTMDDLQLRRGLRTNATRITPAAWERKIGRILMDEL